MNNTQDKDVSIEPKGGLTAIKGFSKRNLELIRQWYTLWSKVLPTGQQAAAQIAKQPVSQFTRTPWGHNLKRRVKLLHVNPLFLTV